MKKIVVLLMSIVLFLACNCSSTKRKISAKVIGTALNYKEAAKLIDRKGDVYVIDNVASWDSTFVNKIVVVHGQIINVERALKSTSGNDLFQQIDAELDTTVIEQHIINARWQLYRK